MLSKTELWDIFTGAKKPGMREGEADDAGLRAVAEAAVKDERGAEYSEACALAMAIYKRRYMTQSPQFELCPDTVGVITQIDNMVAGLFSDIDAVKDAVGEDKPFGWYFMDDPKVFTLPGVGFRVGAEPPTDSIDRIPLYTRPQASQLNLDYLREMGRLEARIRELEQASAAVPEGFVLVPIATVLDAAAALIKSVGDHADDLGKRLAASQPEVKS